MKINYTETYEEHICGVCGYKHMIKYSNHPDRYSVDPGYGKKPFKEGETQFIFNTGNGEEDYRPNVLVKKNIYACPKCGTLQINTD